MSKKTTTLEKKTFIGLVINKLASTRNKDLTTRITAKSDNLEVQYKTAQRYARDYIYTREGEQEKLFKELEELVKQQADVPPDAITELDAEAPVEGDTPCRASEMCHWLVGIDDGIINGTIAEAKQFISTIDDYCDRLRDLMAEKAKCELKEHLQQIRQLETVLEKTEIEDIWLEVATEGGELITTPFSAETNTKVVDLPDIEELEPTNESIAV